MRTTTQSVAVGLSRVDIELTIPTRQDVENLKVGDLAPDAFGKMAEVVEITAKQDNVKGKLFRYYHVRWGAGGRMSNIITEDQLVRTVATSNHFTSAQLDTIERNFLAADAMRRVRGSVESTHTEDGFSVTAKKESK